MITLQGLTPRQRLIADILWLTEDRAEVDRLCSLDQDARVVRELIVAAELDQVLAESPELLDVARNVLEHYRL